MHCSGPGWHLGRSSGQAGRQDPRFASTILDSFVALLRHSGIFLPSRLFWLRPLSALGWPRRNNRSVAWPQDPRPGGSSTNIAGTSPTAYCLDPPPRPDHDQRHPAQYRHRRGAQRGEGSLRYERSRQPCPLRRGDHGDARWQYPHGAALRALSPRHDPRTRAVGCGTPTVANSSTSSANTPLASMATRIR